MLIIAVNIKPCMISCDMSIVKFNIRANQFEVEIKWRKRRSPQQNVIVEVEWSFDLEVSCISECE